MPQSHKTDQLLYHDGTHTHTHARHQYNYSQTSNSLFLSEVIAKTGKCTKNYFKTPGQNTTTLPYIQWEQHQIMNLKTKKTPPKNAHQRQPVDVEL